MPKHIGDNQLEVTAEDKRTIEMMQMYLEIDNLKPIDQMSDKEVQEILFFNSQRFNWDGCHIVIEKDSFLSRLRGHLSTILSLFKRGPKNDH